MSYLLKSFPPAPASRKALIASAFALALTFCAAPVAASENLAATVTAEERAACMPDVFRLCSSAVPNVKGVIACMKRERPRLSPACAQVFDARVARSKGGTRAGT